MRGGLIMSALFFRHLGSEFISTFKIHPQLFELIIHIPLL